MKNYPQDVLRVAISQLKGGEKMPNEKEDPKIYDYMQIFRGIVYDELQAKTGWGRNELMSLFERSMAKAFLQITTEFVKGAE